MNGRTIFEDRMTILAIRSATKKAAMALNSHSDDATAIKEVLAEIEAIETMEMNVEWEDEKESLLASVSVFSLSLSLSLGCILCQILTDCLPSSLAAPAQPWFS